jgi:putative endonuclease
MYYVYILASINRVLYVGSTDNLRRRVAEHKRGRGNAFTARYRVHRLVYYETCADRAEAVRREYEIKRWPRAKKVALIESVNPEWVETGGVRAPPVPQIPS